MNFTNKLMKIPNISLLGIFLFVLALIGIYKNGTNFIWPILITVLTASILDLIIIYIKEKKFIIPKSATISGLFIGGILAPNQSLIIYFIAPIVAILSKHLIKFNKKHIFNPSAFGLIFSVIFFKAILNWWIDSLIWLVLIFGIFLAYKMKRFHLIFSFIITFEILMLIYTIVNKLNISHLLSLSFFFMLFMLVEPITSPVSKKSRIAFGIFAAVLSFVLFHYWPRYDPYLLSLLIADLFVPLLNKKLM